MFSRDIKVTLSIKNDKRSTIPRIAQVNIR